MASWIDEPKPEDADELRHDEYRGLIPPYDVEPDDDPADVEYADEDETGQLGLGVPGEQRTPKRRRRPCSPDGHSGMKRSTG